MKTIYTLSINDFSYMAETSDYSRMSWYWLPKRIKERAYSNVMLQFMEMIQPNEITKHFNNELIKLRLYNLAENLLPAMYISLRNKFTTEMADDFEKMFRFRPTKIEDLKVIIDKIESTRRKYKAYLTTVENEVPNGNTIEHMLTGLEMVLERNINRDLAVYQLKYLYESAMEKIKQIEKHGNNR